MSNPCQCAHKFNATMLRIKSKGKPELTMTSRKAVFCMLYSRANNGRISDEQKVRVARAFDKSESAVRRVFCTTVKNMEARLEAEGTMEAIESLHLLRESKLPLADFTDDVFESNKKGNCGRKRKYDRSV